MQEQVHVDYMQRCLQLAKLGAGSVAPNPMVGAVLVHNGQIIGEGFHQKYGGFHAEVHCINDALVQFPEKIAQSTLYVSLEPCAHFGKTPPCADLIIQHKIPKVVIACNDSYGEVNGKSTQKLKAARVDVTVGICENEAIELNKTFFTYHTQKRPYVVLKWAQTANGYMAANDGERLIITNDYSNQMVHRWRSECAAIMIGANTAICDNPLLDNRKWWGTAPKKILFDPQLKVPKTLRLFDGKEVVTVLNTVKDAISGTVLYVKMDKNNLIHDALVQLFQHHIQSILVEGGQQLLQGFINAGLWDEARIITNKNLYINEGLPSPLLDAQILLQSQTWENDEMLYLKNKNNTLIHAATGLF